ncbi:MAG: DctP family TRAP transporter solute-binding subunit [Mycobacterium sp.]
MKTIMKLAVVAASAVTAVAAAGCGGNGGGADGADGGGVATLRIGTNVDAQHPYMRCGWDTWADELDGMFDVQVFTSNQLGTNVEMVDSITAGNLEMTTVGASEIAQFWPRVSVLEAPYLYNDFSHAQKVLASDEGQQLISDLQEQTNLRTLGMWYYGTRHFTTTDQAVRSPADLNGLKIRVPDNAVYLAAVNAMGATSTPVAFGELYVALSSGVVDGQENPISTIASQAFNEVQNYINLTGHVVSTGLTVVNNGWYEGLSDEQKDALEAVQETSTQSVLNCIQEEESAYLDEWEASGQMQVIRDVNRDAFAANVQEVLPAEFDRTSDWGGLYQTFRGMAD